MSASSLAGRAGAGLDRDSSPAGVRAAGRRGEILAAVARAGSQRRVAARPIRRSTGAKRRTSAGRSRFPAVDRRRPSSGAIGCICSRPSLPACRRAEAHQPRGGVAPARHARLQGAGHQSLATAASPGSAPPANEPPHEASHQDNGTWASSSAVTDGQHVIASFESRGLYCYDMNGTLVWEKDLGDKKMRNEFGEGSTPALHGDTLVVVWDHYVPGQSFIVALDKRTGAELWRVEARRDRHLGDAAHRRARRARPGHRPRHEPPAQLRPEDRRRDLGNGGTDDEPDSIAGRRRRHGVRDQRLPRQQPQGDSPGGRQRRHHRHADTSRGRSTATRRMCRHRFSTTACCTS